MTRALRSRHFPPQSFYCHRFHTNSFLLCLLVCTCTFCLISVFVSGISEFLFIIEEEHLQQLDSKFSFYKMVFITGKLFSASTTHANKKFN